ncbi:fimbrial protein [Rahnella aquatilis]|uniref:fimbrial protein n=1 Tax=Rahnella aquatilis TaxID=34038 RepID=UPI003656A268
MNKSNLLAAAILSVVATGAAQASDGQIQLNGNILNQTCTVAVDGTPTANSTIVLDGIPAADLEKNTLNTVPGGTLKGSDVMRTIQITLQDCALPSGKTKVGVSFDNTGYGQSAYSTYRNMLLDSVNTVATAARGVGIGFTSTANASDLIMGDTKAEYTAPEAGGVLAYDYQIRYVRTAGEAADVVAGDLDSVATFSLVYE